MENNNNNGRGLFYGVIGVATLVVTIIGATFAYFSASISSGTEAIQTNAANISLSITENLTGIKGGIVPVDEAALDQYFTKTNIGGNASTDAADTGNCIDDDGNPFCSVFSFTIKNPSTAAQTVYARMDVATNSFTANVAKHIGGEEKVGEAEGTTACTGYMGYDTSWGLNNSRSLKDHASLSLTDRDSTAEKIYCNDSNTMSNLAFAIFKGAPSEINDWSVLKQVNDEYTVSGTVPVANHNSQGLTGNASVDANTAAGNTVGTTVIGKLGELVVSRTAVVTGPSTIEFPELTQTLRANGEVTYTVLVWLHENWTDQEADEMKSFGAGITFSTSQGGSGVTATLAAS